MIGKLNVSVLNVNIVGGMYSTIYHITLVTVVLLFLSNSSTFAQKFNPQNLSEISNNQITISSNKLNRVLKYLDEYGYDKKSIELGDGKNAFLKDVIKGIPQYISTLNLQARKTTGVEYIQSATGLNLNVKGNGITVGVWDGGQALKDHIEFGGRLVNKNGAEYSNHATHVSGTIIAAGINESAMGMAPEANILNYYAFEDDLGPMAIEAANGLLLSNHSYALVLGWSYNPASASWSWFGGDAAVDDRFGFYSSSSRTIDEIAYNAPYYTMVWAAGNDRSDVGDGSKPPDGPYGIIGPYGVSKNVITVGAITGFDAYVDQSSIVMSDFSSWGPTDDGRIKPDIVADGVNVFSTSSSGVESYTSLSGTSMAAPNVTGSLAVLQDYYHQVSDTFLTSASLKSLIIHSAREAGTAGPDIQFGWGVLNALDAIKTIQGQNGVDTLLLNVKLIDQDTFSIELFSDGLTPITATLAWTDVPGDPGAPGTDKLLLKNDLDIRLIDDEGNITFPWFLDPKNPLNALKGDNVRDNVEKFEFINVKPRRYKLLVSHKNSLVNSEQSFGLTLTGGAISTNRQSEFYWISSFGNLSDIQNWSINSGGLPATNVALANSTIVFDNNSLLNDGDIVVLSESVSVENFIWLSNKNVTLDLNGDTLTITSQFKISGDNLIIRNGVLVYSSNKSDLVSLNFDGKDGTHLILDSNQSLKISSNVNLAGLTILSGEVSIESKGITVNNLNVSVNGGLFLTNNIISIDSSISILSEQFRSNNNVWELRDATGGSPFPIVFDDIFNVIGSSKFSGLFYIRKVVNQGHMLSVEGHIRVDSLIVEEGSNVSIMESDTLGVIKFIDIVSTALKPVSISGGAINNPSFIQVDFRNKLCFDNLILSNLDLVGDAIMNVGINSTLTNTTNFSEGNCESVLYANFNILNNCSQSVIHIDNTSEGSIISYDWMFVNGATVLNLENQDKPEVFYPREGLYDIILNVSNESDAHTFANTVRIDSNTMAAVRVVENSSGLVSDKAGDSYQWYMDGHKLLGDTLRTLSPVSSGSYQVAYFLNNNSCLNRISEPVEVLVTGLIFEDELNSQKVSIYPNPFTNNFKIDGLVKGDEVLIFDVSGNLLFDKNINDAKFVFDMTAYKGGLYIVKVIGVNFVFQKSLLKLNY